MKQPRHFLWRTEGKVGVITLNRPERKNPLTFESYAELRDFFRSLKDEKGIAAIVLTGAGGNFCSGGDVHEIIGPLTKMAPAQLLEFTHGVVHHCATGAHHHAGRGRHPHLEYHAIRDALLPAARHPREPRTP